MKIEYKVEYRPHCNSYADLIGICNGIEFKKEFEIDDIWDWSFKRAKKSIVRKFKILFKEEYVFVKRKYEHDPL